MSSIDCLNYKIITPKDCPGLDKLRIATGTVQELAPQEVLISMKAMTLNFRDMTVVQRRLGCIDDVTLGSDGCGVVAAVGSGVTHLTAGDVVAPVFSPGFEAGRWPEKRMAGPVASLGANFHGTMQSLMRVAASDVVVAPAGMPFEDVAALNCAGITAWNALFDEEEAPASMEGKVVLAEGTGGVSLLGLQIVKALGAKTIVLTSSDEKGEQLKKDGVADWFVNYKTTPNWEETVVEITGGVDIFLAMVGAPTFEKAVKVCNRDGYIAVVGCLDMAGFTQTYNLPYFDILMKALSVRGIMVGHKKHYERALRFFAKHNIRPYISTIFDASSLQEGKQEALDTVKKAFECLNNNKHMGKIAIKLA